MRRLVKRPNVSARNLFPFWCWSVLSKSAQCIWAFQYQKRHAKAKIYLRRAKKGLGLASASSNGIEQAGLPRDRRQCDANAIWREPRHATGHVRSLTLLRFCAISMSNEAHFILTSSHPTRAPRFHKKHRINALRQARPFSALKRPESHDICCLLFSIRNFILNENHRRKQP